MITGVFIMMMEVEEVMVMMTMLKIVFDNGVYDLTTNDDDDDDDCSDGSDILVSMCI